MSQTRPPQSDWEALIEQYSQELLRAHQRQTLPINEIPSPEETDIPVLTAIQEGQPAVAPAAETVGLTDPPTDDPLPLYPLEETDTSPADTAADQTDDAEEIPLTDAEATLEFPSSDMDDATANPDTVDDSAMDYPDMSRQEETMEELRPLPPVVDDDVPMPDLSDEPDVSPAPPAIPTPTEQPTMPTDQFQPPDIPAPRMEEPGETPGSDTMPTPPLSSRPALQTEDAYLQVIVTTAQNALPIQGATVVITQMVDGTKQLLQVLTTDVSGRTPVVTLPAVKGSYSLQPGTDTPYTAYGVEVSYPSYYRVEDINVPLFGGITSLQPVRLIPLPAGYQGDGVISYQETEPDL